MRTLRTPADRFPGSDHRPGYAEVHDGDGDTPRMAWVAAGPPDGPRQG